MNTQFKNSFAKDLRAIKDKSVLMCAKQAIQAVEQADTLLELANVKN